MAFKKKGNVVQSRLFRLSRSNTTAQQVATLPPQSIIIGCTTFGTASNAGTTGVISVGTTSASANEIGTFDVKTTSGLAIHNAAEFASAALDTSLAFNQQSTGISIFAKYAETGTASSAGGDWAVLLTFI